MLLKFIKKIAINLFQFNINFKLRLIVYFIILAIIPSSFISISTYYTRGIITSKVNSSTITTLLTIQDEINQKFANINNIFNLIYLNSDFMRILVSSSPQNKLDFIDEISSLDKILDNFTISATDNITIYPKLYMYNRPEYAQNDFTDKVSYLDTISSEIWYTKLPPRFSYSIVGTSEVYTTSGIIPTVKIAKKLYGLKNYKIPYVGLLTDAMK